MRILIHAKSSQYLIKLWLQGRGSLDSIWKTQNIRYIKCMTTLVLTSPCSQQFSLGPHLGALRGWSTWAASIRDRMFWEFHSQVLMPNGRALPLAPGQSPMLPSPTDCKSPAHVTSFSLIDMARPNTLSPGTVPQEVEHQTERSSWDQMFPFARILLWKKKEQRALTQPIFQAKVLCI